MLLTAMLLLMLEPALFERIGYAWEAVRIFRAPTTWLNIRYLVWRPAVPVRRDLTDTWIDSKII